jgi:hypothetical protein
MLALVTAEAGHVVRDELKPWLAERALDVALARILMVNDELVDAIAIWTRCAPAPSYSH